MNGMALLTFCDKTSDKVNLQKQGLNSAYGAIGLEFMVAEWRHGLAAEVTQFTACSPSKSHGEQTMGSADL